MSKFKTGDKVIAIDENLSGTITSIKKHVIFIVTDEALQYEFTSSELIIDRSLEIPDFKIEAVVDRFNLKTNKKESPAISESVEIDLHIQHLTDRDKYMQPFEKLTIQKDKIELELNNARKNRTPKIIFVHGIGKGVLRKELELILNRQPDLKYYDADYNKYGSGATEVYFYQNPKN